ncbi:MAG: hypothetical protein SGJ27_17110 [Candidatus Melainabacteria bacterium]|nr:hypothetical protein [Candidatus Melainabacteria bacterium]
MSELRTQDASGLLICQHCGVVLKTRSKTCRDCGNVTSRYSTTVIPVLVINRKPATAPQHLKPENDPLIVERVVTRCKFNEVMTPKIPAFHGSRAFFSDQTHERPGNVPAAPASAPAAAASPRVAANQQEFDPFARSSQSSQPGAIQPVQPGAPQQLPQPGAMQSPQAEPPQQYGSNSNAENQDLLPHERNAQNEDDEPLTEPKNGGRNLLFPDDGSLDSPDFFAAGVNATQSEPADFFAAPAADSSAQDGPADFFAAPTVTPQQQGSLEPGAQQEQSASMPVQDEGPLQTSAQPESPLRAPHANQTSSVSNAPAQNRTTGSDEKVVRQAHPSYMVADHFLLVVQENDGQTISVTQTIDGPENEPVFGLLPAPSTFNLCALQVMPDGSVSLSGSSLSFHDANKEAEFSAPPEVDLAVNIDSRLAFEQGLSRVAALRLQGALGKSGVLGFESQSSDDDLRKKFTRKPVFSETDGDVIQESGTADDITAGPPKIKERSVFKPKKAADIESLNKIESIGDIKPIKPAKNPLAMVGAAVGILAVSATLVFVGLQKFGPLVSESGSIGATLGGASSSSLPKQWHMVLTRTVEVATIYQDFETEINQSGGALSGKGHDAIGDFTITGELKKDNSITLQKQYDTAGYIWPIMFSGQVSQGQSGSFAGGSYFWRKSDQERVQGDWQAMLPQANVAAPTGNPTSPTANPTPSGSVNQMISTPESRL